MSSSKYDVIIVGAGIAGPSMAFALSSSSALRSSLPQDNQRTKPLRILLIERSLRTPDRIVGELLQPGGVLALRRLGLERALDNIDAVRAKGYCIIRPKGKPEDSSAGTSKDAGAQFEQVYIPYPNEQEGRSFHHGEFVSALRSCAASAPGVTVLEANVSSKVVYCPHTGRILGVRATPTGENLKEQIYLAKLTIFASGSSTFRRAVYLPTSVEERETTSTSSPLPPPSEFTPVRRNLNTKALGTFYGLVLPHPSVSHILPIYQHGTVILIPGSAGPLLLYQISTVDTRILIDIPKGHPYAKNVQGYVKDVILPNLPTEALRESLQNLIEDNESTSGRLKLRSMENPFFPAPPQGGRRTREGSILIGDAWNQRHPLTGGGMTVALWDVVTLATELIMAEKALFGDISFSTPPTPVTEGMKGYSKHGDTLTEVNGELLSLQKHEEEWTMGQWDIMDEIFDRWWWKRKGYAATINILSVALYDLFGGSSSNLAALQTGCFKYFELGGECVNGPVSLLAGLTPSPFLLFSHFFSVAFYSLWVMFTHAQPHLVITQDRQPKHDSNGHASTIIDGYTEGAIVMRRPSILEYPHLLIKGFAVFWTACVVFGPLMWTEIMWW